MEGQWSGCRPSAKFDRRSSRGNAVREERRVHLATLPRSEGRSEATPTASVLLWCRVRREHDVVSTIM